MFSRGLETTAVSGTVAVVEPRDSRTKVSFTGAATPPAVAMTSSRRSPFSVRGTRPPPRLETGPPRLAAARRAPPPPGAAASPSTVTLVLSGELTVRSTCAWIALPASSCSIWACTSGARLPATLMRPA